VAVGDVSNVRRQRNQRRSSTCHDCISPLSPRMPFDILYEPPAVCCQHCGTAFDLFGDSGIRARIVEHSKSCVLLLSAKANASESVAAVATDIKQGNVKQPPVSPVCCQHCGKQFAYLRSASSDDSAHVDAVVAEQIMQHGLLCGCIVRDLINDCSKP
jgi:hypothetical protein